MIGSEKKKKLVVSLILAVCWGVVDGRNSPRADMRNPLESEEGQEMLKRTLEQKKKQKRKVDRVELRMEKYDRLIKMAEKASLDMPSIRESIEALKERERLMLETDKENDLPLTKPRLDDDEEDTERFKKREFDESRREVLLRHKERLEKLRDLKPEERIAEIRRESQERARSESGTTSSENKKQRLKMPPSDMDGVAKLPPNKRDAKIQKHQKRMKDHKKMKEEWRQQNQAFIDERREISEAYHKLNQQVREAVFASRPL